MKNKKRSLTVKFVAFILSIICASFLLFVPQVRVAKAEEDIEPYGLFTKIELNIYSKQSLIIAQASNKFTLFPSEICVNIYLYSSESYQEDYNLMNLESRESILDLDQGKILETFGNTGGVQKYWCAVMRYKFDDRDWVEKQTRTILFSANGDVLG